MKKLMVVMHMSGAYAEQTFYKEKKRGLANMSDHLSGY